MVVFQHVNFPLSDTDLARLDKLMQELDKPPGTVTRATLAALLRADGVLIIARDESEQIVSMGSLTITATLDGPKAVIEHVATLEEARRQGIGGEIVERLAACAERKGFKRVSLTSHPRRNTRHFYEDLGFEVYDTTTFRRDFRKVQAPRAFEAELASA